MLPESLIVELRRQLVLDQPNCMEGWTSPERGIEMAELMFEHKPSIVVEIGCFGGRSTVAMALALRELGQGIVYTIDPWKKDIAVEGECEANRNWWNSVDLHWVHSKAMDGFWRLGLDRQVVVIRNASQYVSELFNSIDHLLIDGCHSEVASCRDVSLYVPKLRSGGTLWFDDTDWVSTRKALDHVEENCELLKDGREYRIYRKK